MGTTIYDENVEGGFRYATDTEETAINILKAAINIILNSPDLDSTIHRTNDCDAMSLAEGAVRAAMGTGSIPMQRRALIGEFYRTDCSTEKCESVHGDCSICQAEYERQRTKEGAP